MDNVDIRLRRLKPRDSFSYAVGRRVYEASHKDFLKNMADRAGGEPVYLAGRIIRVTAYEVGGYLYIIDNTSTGVQVENCSRKETSEGELEYHFAKVEDILRDKMRGIG